MYSNSFLFVKGKCMGGQGFLILKNRVMTREESLNGSIDMGKPWL
jgi:hypothetical protein